MIRKSPLMFPENGAKAEAFALEYLISREIIPNTDDYMAAMDESMLREKVANFYDTELRTQCHGDSVEVAMQKYSTVAGWDLDTYRSWPSVKKRLEEELDRLNG